MASQREVLSKLQRKAQLMKVNRTDERESGTTTLMVDGDWRFRRRKWKDLYFFFWEGSRESVRKWKRSQYLKKIRREKETLAYQLALPQRNREAISGSESASFLAALSSIQLLCSELPTHPCYSIHDLIGTVDKANCRKPSSSF